MNFKSSYIKEVRNELYVCKLHTSKYITNLLKPYWEPSFLKLFGLNFVDKTIFSIFFEQRKLAATKRQSRH